MRYKKSALSSAKFLASTAIVAVTAPQFAFAQAGPEVGAPQQYSQTIDEIVVTAQRRAERSQDVPIAITAVSGEGLRERAVTDLQGMQNQVPSLTVAPNGQASRDVMSPTIRGLGASFQGSPGVVVYMNEVPLVSGVSLNSQGGPGNFVDLQNIQVLSGVQGTLFGRNTTGGAILLTAARPSNEFGGYIAAGAGNYNMTELEAVLNVPLSDRLAVRVVGATRYRDGYTRDSEWNKDRDDQHWRTARVGVQWNPTDNISSYTMGYYGYSKTNGTGMVPIKFNTDLIKFYSDTYGYAYGMPNFRLCTAPTATPPSDCSAFTTVSDEQEQRGPREVRHGLDSFMKTEAWSVMNSTDVDLTEGLTLRNIISFASAKSFYANDTDGSAFNLYNTGNTGPLQLSRRTPRDHYELFTEELQFQGQALEDKLNYTAGGFYSKQKPGGPMEDYSSNLCAFPGPDGADICASYRSTAVTNETKALFAQATIDLGAFSSALDGVRITGGYRYTWEKVKGFTVSYSPGLGTGPVTCSVDGARNIPRENARQLATNVNGVRAGGCGVSAQESSSAANWTIGLDYKPVENLLLYAKVSRGYKAGGFNAFAVNEIFQTFGPEFVTDYEAGFKSDFSIAGRPVRLNVNGYSMDYSKIQRGLPDFNTTTNSAGAAVIATGSARIRGVEIEAMIRPIDGVEIGGNFSHIDAKYKSFKYTASRPVWDCNSASATEAEKTVNVDLTCLPLQYLSPNIFSIYGRVQVPVSESLGDISLYASYAWADRQHTAPSSLETFPNGDIWEPGVVLPSYGTLSATITWQNFLRKGLELSAFGTNLTNKTYAISNMGSYSAAGVQVMVYGEPRMYGLRLKYNF